MTNPYSATREEEYKLLLLNAHIAAQTGDGAKALRILEPVVLEELPVTLKAGYYAVCGEAFFRIGNYQEVISNLENALKGYRRGEVDVVASPLQIAQLYVLLGSAYYNQNQHKTALKYHKLCLQAILDGYIIEARFKFQLFNNLGNEYLALGQLDLAGQYYQQALELAQPGEDGLLVGNTYWGLGLVMRQRSKFEAAKANMLKAQEIYTREKAYKYMGGLKNTLGWILIELEEYEAAEAQFFSAKDLAIQAGNNITLCEIYVNLAYLYFRRQSLEKAYQNCQEAVTLARTLEGNNKQPLAMALAQLGEILLAKGAPFEESKQAFEEALVQLKATSSDEYARRVHQRYAEALKKAGYINEAFDVLSQAYKYFAEQDPSEYQP